MAWFKKQKNQGMSQRAGERRRLTLSEIAMTGGSGRIRDVSNALWFPAGQPINPVAPRGTPPRRYPYQPMSNISWTERDGQVDIQTLRNFSYYPIVRDIIETVKDLLSGVDWEWQLVPEDDEEPGSSVRQRSRKDPRLKELRKFFRKPDGVLPFRQWMRGLYDDMLVIDAASIWKQRDTSNRICSLIQIDGGQVFPLIDESGLQPAAASDSGESLKYFVQNSLKKADNEYLAKKAVYDQQRTGGSPAFQLTPYGFPAQQLTSDELTYALYNRLSYRRYGFSKVEICLAYIALGLGRLDFQAAFYRSGNMPEGIAFLPPDVPVGRVEELNKYLDTILSGQMRNRRRIIFLPSYGAEKQPNLIFPKVNEQVLKDEFDDMLVRYLCHNFGLDPASFIKQPARLGGGKEPGQQAQKNEALKPCLAWAKDLLDGIVQDDLGYTDIEAKIVQETDLDEEKQSMIALNELENGLQTLDEARDKRGYDTIGEEWSQVPLVKIATGYVRVDGLPMPGQQMGMDAGMSGVHGGPLQPEEQDDEDDQQGGPGGGGGGDGDQGDGGGGGDTHNYYFGGSGQQGQKVVKTQLIRKSPVLVVRRVVGVKTIKGEEKPFILCGNCASPIEVLEKPYNSNKEVPDYVPEASKAQWRHVWNSAYHAALKEGKSAKDAEASAFAQANGVAGPNAKKGASISTGSGLSFQGIADGPTPEKKKEPEEDWLDKVRPNGDSGVGKTWSPEAREAAAVARSRGEYSPMRGWISKEGKEIHIGPSELHTKSAQQNGLGATETQALRNGHIHCTYSNSVAEFFSANPLPGGANQIYTAERQDENSVKLVRDAVVRSNPQTETFAIDFGHGGGFHDGLSRAEALRYLDSLKPVDKVDGDWLDKLTFAPRVDKVSKPHEHVHAEEGQDISATVGIKPTGGTELQFIIFSPKDKWTKESVAAWCRAHGKKADEILETESSFRSRQNDSGKYKNIRTIPFTKAAKARLHDSRHDWPLGDPTSAYIAPSRMTEESKKATQELRKALETAFATMREKVGKLAKAAPDQDVRPNDNFDTMSIEEADVALKSAENQLWGEVEPDFYLLADSIKRALKDAAASGVALSAEDLGITKNLDMTNKAAMDWAENRAAELIGKKVVGGQLVDNPTAKWAITDSTRDAIKKLVTKAFEDGTTIKQLVPVVQETLASGGAGVFTDARAAMIAKTEVGRAQMGAQLLTWEDSDDDLIMKWVCISEEPCEECFANDGALAEIGEEFPNGWQSTLDSHPNCNCLVIAMQRQNPDAVVARTDELQPASDTV